MVYIFNVGGGALRVQETADRDFLEAVARTVDQSPLVYDLFEEKHHLLESLTKRQVELTVLAVPSRVLVIGCGTGISAMTIRNMLSNPECCTRIFGIDINERMLCKARERYRNIPGLYFIRGDADNIESFFQQGFDGIFYSPSISHIANFRESVRQACNLLVPDGFISICDFAGLFDENGEDLLRKAIPESRHISGFVSLLKDDPFLRSIQEVRTTRFDFRMEAASGFLFDYMSIPTRSAELFPKLPYLERIPKIREICATLEEKEGPVFLGWKFHIIRKGRRPAS